MLDSNPARNRHTRFRTLQKNFLKHNEDSTAGQVAPQSHLEESANDRGEAGVGGGTQNQSTSAFSTFEDPSFGGVFS